MTKENDATPKGTFVEDVAENDQLIVVFDGTGVPLILTDTMEPDQAREYVSSPFVRQLMAVRLQHWADVFAAPDKEQPTTMLGFDE